MADLTKPFKWYKSFTTFQSGLDNGSIVLDVNTHYYFEDINVHCIAGSLIGNIVIDLNSTDLLKNNSIFNAMLTYIGGVTGESMGFTSVTGLAFTVTDGTFTAPLQFDVANAYFTFRQPIVEGQAFVGAVESQLRLDFTADMNIIFGIGITRNVIFPYTEGDGTKFLADDGSYKEIASSGSNGGNVHYAFGTARGLTNTGTYQRIVPSGYTDGSLVLNEGDMVTFRRTQDETLTLPLSFYANNEDVKVYSPSFNAYINSENYPIFPKGVYTAVYTDMEYLAIISTPNDGIGYPKVNHGTSDITFELTPNVLHVWDEVSALTLTLGGERSGITNEYIFQFTSGSTATTLTLPDGIKWANDSAPIIKEKTIYQISILGGLASALSFSGITTITFYVALSGGWQPYLCEEGMTWSEFVNSEYNTNVAHVLSITDNKVGWASFFITGQTANDVIIKDTQYSTYYDD